MVPQISKEIISNFSYKYERRSTTFQRSSRIISSSKPDSDTNNTTVVSPPRSIIDGISVSNYSRCYVEEYMTSNVGESLLVMIPSRHRDDHFSNWFSLMGSDIPYIDISFTKHDYRGYIGSVITRILTVVTMILTITLNVFFFMVKTCDKTATKKTFLGTLYEATQQNVMGLDLLIGFAVIGVIYIKYTGKSARDFGF